MKKIIILLLIFGFRINLQFTNGDQVKKKTVQKKKRQPPSSRAQP